MFLGTKTCKGNNYWCDVIIKNIHLFCSNVRDFGMVVKLVLSYDRAKMTKIVDFCSEMVDFAGPVTYIFIYIYILW